MTEKQYPEPSVNWAAFHKAVDAYIEDYEMVGEDEDGRVIA